MKTSPPRHGLARVLSKRGLCSRTQAAQWISQGRVRVDGRVIRDPEFPITADGAQQIAIDGDEAGQAPARLYLMLNKPRGLVTTARDDRGRETVYRCFDGAQVDDGQGGGMPLPWVAPVGRLDKASEGLLLFCNDPAWAARITDPERGPTKTYHVQVDTQPGPELLLALEAGVDCEGECLRARQARVLRLGERNAWLEIVLDEGRNRQIRRLLAAFDIAVLRLVRVAVGPLELGGLAKGQWRLLSSGEVDALRA
ncbi:rRNA pseudouridine synthase [Lysobacter solisilvae]|uniref:Dual-specificity RNA pseudouridine synthase RluF n=1 Tax=Agrilutibacter solisilvae TaxID=2763317 RepID=A0A975AR45_9GAMM|nr:pseudouridine synthase [Lysobacter solisilvae]QSX76928.1 rRNA pseudouridine synthase [Lysobacter solisilvae]